MEARGSNKFYSTITIAISTVAENLDKLINNFDFLSLDNADEVAIIVQGEIDDEQLIGLKKFTIIKDAGIGISRSRNIALFHANCDYIWFVDDDIVLNSDAILKVKKYISRYDADIFTVRMGVIGVDSLYKIYPKKHRLERRDIIGISSVEIIASTKFVMKSKVKFNEGIGLGTKYPSCEENIFLLDVFDIGGVFIHIPEIVQNHPEVNRKHLFLKADVLAAKGVFCRRYGGVRGFLIMLSWFIKSLLYGSNINSSFCLMSGYSNANNILDK